MTRLRAVACKYRTVNCDRLLHVFFSVVNFAGFHGTWNQNLFLQSHFWRRSILLEQEENHRADTCFQVFQKKCVLPCTTLVHCAVKRFAHTKTRTIIWYHDLFESQRLFLHDCFYHYSVSFSLSFRFPIFCSLSTLCEIHFTNNFHAPWALKWLQSTTQSSILDESLEFQKRREKTFLVTRLLSNTVPPCVSTLWSQYSTDDGNCDAITHIRKTLEGLSIVHARRKPPRCGIIFVPFCTADYFSTTKSFDASLFEANISSKKWRQYFNQRGRVQIPKHFVKILLQPKRQGKKSKTSLHSKHRAVDPEEVAQHQNEQPKMCATRVVSILQMSLWWTGQVSQHNGPSGHQIRCEFALVSTYFHSLLQQAHARRWTEMPLWDKGIVSLWSKWTFV